MIMGDMNAKVSSDKHDNVVGIWGLGTRNDRGNRLIEFCEEKDLVILNTFFKHHKRRPYT